MAPKTKKKNTKKTLGTILGWLGVFIFVLNVFLAVYFSSRISSITIFGILCAVGIILLIIGSGLSKK